MSANDLPFRAVSIKPGNDCCQAVRDLGDKRFLTLEAPQLPLQDCSEYASCTCKYQKWDDRRQEDRRALKTGIAGQYFQGDDRRAGRERRRGGLG